MFLVLLFSVFSLLEAGIAKKYYITMTELNLTGLKSCETLIETKLIIIPPDNKTHNELTFKMLNNGGETLYFTGMTRVEEKNLFEVDLEEGVEYKLVVPRTEYFWEEKQETLKVQKGLVGVKVGRVNFTVDKCSYNGEPGCPMKTYMYPSASDKKGYLSIVYNINTSCQIHSLSLNADKYNGFILSDVVNHTGYHSIVIPINSNSTLTLMDKAGNMLGKVDIPFNNETFKKDNLIPSCGLVIEYREERKRAADAMREDLQSTLFNKMGAEKQEEYRIWVCVRSQENETTCDEGDVIQRLKTNDKPLIFNIKLEYPRNSTSVVDLIVWEGKSGSPIGGKAMYGRHVIQNIEGKPLNNYLCAKHVCIHLFSLWAYETRTYKAKTIEVDFEGLSKIVPNYIPSVSALPYHPCEIPQTEETHGNLTILDYSKKTWLSVSLNYYNYSLPVSFNLMAKKQMKLAPNGVADIDETQPALLYTATKV